MRTIKESFTLDKQIYELYFQSKLVKCFLSEDSTVSIITDNLNNVLFTISADCAQNSGFLNFTKE